MSWELKVEKELTENRWTFMSVVKRGHKFSEHKLYHGQVKTLVFQYVVLLLPAFYNGLLQHSLICILFLLDEPKPRRIEQLNTLYLKAIFSAIERYMEFSCTNFFATNEYNCPLLCTMGIGLVLP